MANKKYILKTEVEKFSDGSSNEEHIKDILAEMEMLYGNIQDNNDICLQVYKVKQEADKDIVDAISIVCDTLIEIEKQAGKIMQVIEKYDGKLDKNCQLELESLLKAVKNYEKKSKKLMESVLIN
ncbi:MAG: hypothetical protein IJX25_05110 [Clostridia bacterium]|nr:hypothetical protein [Clostridia bacterium]